MKNFLNIAIFTFLSLSIGISALQAQSTMIKLADIDSSSSFIVSDSNNITLSRLNGDGGYYIIGNTTYGPGIVPVAGAGTRLMWYPYKKAFRAGYVNSTQWDDVQIGISSFAAGNSTTASANYSTAMGTNATASGTASTAMGNSVTASGSSSISMGESTTASGASAVSMGYQTQATRENTICMGSYSIASGQGAIALGASDTSNNTFSVAIGRYCKATGYGTTAIGQYVSATGMFSTALGYSTTSSGGSATAFGQSTTASNAGATAGGINAIASGMASVSLGYYTTASADYSVALGCSTLANYGYATAMGRNTTASGQYSVAMGYYVSTNSYAGSFIFGDASTTGVANSSTNHQMTMRFSGGYRFFTNSTTTVGCSLAAGGNSWQTISDSTKKENYKKVNGEYFLSSLSKLKLGSWNYKGQEPEQYRHYGPMAQEIFRYFGKDEYGTIGNETSLASADMDGIMMICLQALEKRTTELNTALTELKAEKEKVAQLEMSFNDLRKEVMKIKCDIQSDAVDKSLTTAGVEKNSKKEILNMMNKGQQP